MLSSDLFPHCIQYHAQVFKCLLSPYNRFDENNKEPVIASLNSHGSLELLNLKYDEDSKKYILASSEELCKLRMDSLTLNNEIKSLNGLNEVVRDFTFTYFDWCPEIMNGTRFLAALDKNSNINLFNIQNGKVNFLFDVKMNARITYIKWIIVKTQHYLITSCSKGGLIISTVEIENDKILKCEVHRNIPGKLRISISNVQHVYSHEKFILLCIKAHSIEMFFLDDFEVTSITKYIGLSVTGICEIGNFEFLITTLDNKAFYMKINVENDKIIIEKYLEVKQTSNSEVHSSSFGIYGLAASNNKVLFFTALYPRIAYDHLVLKQPLVLSVNTLSNRSPQEMLIINKSRNLSRFYDCIEAVRFVGGLKLDYLSMLENRDYEIALNDEFLYYLKLQLIVVRSKLWYYQTRSSIIYSIIIDTERSIKKIIDVLRAFHLLNSLLSKKKISSEETKLSMQCLINFIDIYLKEEIKKEPFKAAQETFRNDLENLQQKCNSLKLSKLVESCLYCSQPILENQLTCTSNHILNRCAITKLQIPFEMNNICLACDCVVIEKSTIDKN
ncbi:CLUMA_CG013555, isoform A [Clunio marinus]|uniref:CLUMA_CG013555, isoform A n=1 Tax=Clunio marinus TaxID=568069 RepID=A0A1J1IP65_9DIPT|nr:CLUMA_CG013555, isoform A [Clunio marinus]